MRDPIQDSIWRSNINTYLSILFIAAFACGAMLIIWHVAYGENPLANVMALYLVQ
jgi:hypothetical protein